MDENWPNYTDIPFKLQVIASIAYHWAVSYNQMQFAQYEKHPIKSIYRIFILSLSPRFVRKHFIHANTDTSINTPFISVLEFSSEMCSFGMSMLWAIESIQYCHKSHHLSDCLNITLAKTHLFGLYKTLVYLIDSYTWMASAHTQNIDEGNRTIDHFRFNPKVCMRWWLE